LQSASEDGIPFRDLGGGGVSERIPTERQVIITSYQFQCCGNITRWQTYVLPGGNGQDGEYDIIFQVWRPTLGVENSGCYIVAGEDIYAEIDLSRDGLVDRSLESVNYLTVQPGDVVGYYMIRKGRSGVDHGIQLEPREEDEGEAVWYSEIMTLITTGNVKKCLGRAPGRTLKLFTNSAPVLSVDVGKRDNHGEIA
jgi:hypothetical protein